MGGEWCRHSLEYSEKQTMKGKRMISSVKSGKRLLILSLAMAFAMVSCVFEYPEAYDVDEGKKAYISFSIVTRGSGKTRAGQEVPGAPAENYIDPSKIKCLLFDGSELFLQDMTTVSRITAMSGDFSLYEITAAVDDEYFRNNIQGMIDFHILVIANYSYWGIEDPGKSLVPGESSVKDCFERLGKMTVTPNPYALLNADQSWTNQRFPMAGIQSFHIPGGALATTSESAPLNISGAGGKDIGMLRALAKIEVIDKINIADGAVFDENVDNTGENACLRIDKLDVKGIMSVGGIVPDYPAWSVDGVCETRQVDKPSIPANATYKIPPTLSEDGVITPDEGKYDQDHAISFSFDSHATDMREDKCPVYSAYVFEYDKTGIDPTRQTYVEITTKGGMGYESMFLPLRVAEYRDGHASSADNLDWLLRNHVYRFEIHGIGQEINVKWTVCDMDTAESEITFE